jgi:hypothetical protein
MKTKIIVCPNYTIGSTVINYIVEVYDYNFSGGIAARGGGYHEHPRLVMNHKPTTSVVVEANRLETYLERFSYLGKNLVIERW